MRNPTQPGLPAPQGLYDPRFEHDACGVSFVASLKGEVSRSIVMMGLGALCNMEHRGATGAEAHGHDRSTGSALHVRDERDAACVVFEPWIVETLRRGKARLRVSAHLFGSTESVYG